MTNISAVSLKNFITKTLGIRELKLNQLYKYDVDKADFRSADVNSDKAADVSEILENDDLYEQFAVLYTEQKDKIEAEEKEEEKVNAESGSNSGAAA